LIGIIAYFVYKRLSPATDSGQKKQSSGKDNSSIKGGEYIDYEEIKEDN
jgi:hypothetical protein